MADIFMPYLPSIFLFCLASKNGMAWLDLGIVAAFADFISF